MRAAAGPEGLPQLMINQTCAPEAHDESADTALREAKQGAHSMQHSGAAERRFRPLRILQLNSILRSGGTDNQCVHLAHGLVNLGQRVWVAGPDGRPFSATCRNLGIPLHVIPREGPLKLSFILGAARFIRRQRVEIVHAHHGRDYWRTVLAAELSRVRPKLVLHRHLAKSLGTWVSRQFLLNRTDAFIAGSQCVSQILREGLFEPDSPEPERRARICIRGDHSKIHVVHGGVDTKRFFPRPSLALRQEWNLEPDHIVFAVVGGYPKPRGKGQREFLAAAARICQAVPEARFLLIGRGELESQLRDDVRRLGLEGCAQLTPWCEDMPAVMNAIDCLVHPQIGTDAFSTVVLEAMACAKPVIATRVDGAMEQVLHGETGFLVDPEDLPGLAQAMRFMVESGKFQRATLGARGRERACSQFDVRTTADRMLSVYRALVQG